MENVHTFTVKMLQAKCKEMGLPSSGNKKQLIDRIENSNGLDCHKSLELANQRMANRIIALEKQLANTRLLVERYKQSELDPVDLSSPYQAFLTLEASPKRPQVLNDAVTSSPTLESRYLSEQRSSETTTSVSSYLNALQIPSTRTYVQSIPQTASSLSQYNVPHEPQTSNCVNNIPNVQPTNIHVQNIPISTKHVTSLYNAHNVQPTNIHVQNTPFTPNPVNISPLCSAPRPQQTNSYVHSIPSTTTFSPQVNSTNGFYQQMFQPPVYMQCEPTHVQPLFTTPTMKNIMSTPFPSAQQPVFQQNQQMINPFGQVREIISLLPDFDPSVDESINSTQFVKRVELLKSAYGWDDRSVVFAVQQKMKGPAKFWVDSLQEMTSMIRRAHETPQEYYYRMYAFGKKGNLNDSAIARHIVNGINDYNLKRKISNEYVSCNQLLNDIISYCNYNEIRTPAVNNKMKRNTNETASSITPTKVDTSTPLDKIKCYNCSKFGHYSVKCPEPQKKTRCEICHRTSHKTSDCVKRK